MKPSFLAWLALLGLGASLAAGIPFWLEAPAGRSNPHDPKSSLFAPAPPNAPLPTPSPTPTYLWEDFETDVTPDFWYPNGPSYMNQTWSTDTAVSGTYSWKMDTGPGVGYGHWTGVTLAVPVDLAGATRLKLWVKCDQNLNTELHWVEGTTNGADGEVWWRNISIVGGAGWQQLNLPLSSFFLTGTPGNSTPDPQSVATVWFYHLVPYNAHTLYIDDIQFTP